MYRDVKNAILKSGRFLRETDDELLKTWFWAGVAAAVQVMPIQKSSNSDCSANEDLCEKCMNTKVLK